LREKRPKKDADVFFHHDNAPPHRAVRVSQFFNENNFEVVPHVPYTPEIALLMNFDGFHAMQVEESHAIFERKCRNFQYLKHYCHSTKSQAFNGYDSVAIWPHPA
jgi:hypothetical protein